MVFNIYIISNKTKLLKCNAICITENENNKCIFLKVRVSKTMNEVIFKSVPSLSWNSDICNFIDTTKVLLLV